MGWLRAFIPQHLSNAQVLGFLDLCTHIKISKRKIKANHGENTKVFAEAFSAETCIYAGEKYIENQRQWKAVKFGRYSMDYSGCEIIAAWNALQSLGEKQWEQKIPDFISIFEKKGAVIFGCWGVAPRAVYRFFLDSGYDTGMTCSTEPAEINAMGERYGTIIVTVYNDARDITKQIHTMNASKNSNNGFILHNCYRLGKDGDYIMGTPCASLYESIRSIHNGAAAPICIIGINPKPGS